MASTSPKPAAVETDCSMRIRRLEFADRERAFLSLLSQLSACPDLTASEFAACFADLAALGDNHVILVAEDLAATAEPKRLILSKGCLFVEDVVVDAAARGRGLGLCIVRCLVEIAKEAGCYKVII